MNKTKNAAKERKPNRRRADWGLFLRLCKEGKPNQQIAKKLGWKTDPKSEDQFKRVRAAKSLARTKGIRVDGKMVFLRDAKLKGEKPKPAKKKKAKVRSAAAQPI